MTQNSYDFSNAIRDVSMDFDTMIESSPSLLKLMGSLGTSLDIISGQPIVTNTKYEWVNDTMSQYKSAITGFGASDGDGVDLRVASTEGFEVGSLIRFESATGASKSEIVKVGAVVSSTQLTIIRDYGSTTGVTLVVGWVAFLVSTPKNEDSSVGSAIKHEGVLDFNYTEIFDEVANLSNTSKAIRTYDSATQMAVQMKAAMVRLARKLENAIIHGVKVQRTSSENGSLGGILSYISASGGNIDSTGGAISQTIINNIIENVIADGGDLTNCILLCAPNQARKISALNTAGSNPTVFKDISDRTLGSFTTAFIGDLPVLGKGITAQVFVAQNMVRDKIAVLDMNRINIRTMRGLQAFNATTNGTDGEKQRILAELTLEVKNGTKAHGIATGLSL